MRRMRALGICGLLLVSGCAGPNRGMGVDAEGRTRLLQIPRPWSGGPLNAPKGVSGPGDWAPSVAMADPADPGRSVGPDRPSPLRRPDPNRRSASGPVALAAWEGRMSEPEEPRIPVLPVALHIEAPPDALAEELADQDDSAVLVRTEAGPASEPDPLPPPTRRPARLPGPVEAEGPTGGPGQSLLPPDLKVDRPAYDVAPRQPSPNRTARPAPAPLPPAAEAGDETPAPARRSIPLTVEAPPAVRRPRASLPGPAEATAAAEPGRAALPGPVEADDAPPPPERLSLRPSPRPRASAPPPVAVTSPRRPCPHCEPSLDPNAPPRDLRPTASPYPDAQPQLRPRLTWRPRFLRLFRGDENSSAR